MYPVGADNIQDIFREVNSKTKRKSVEKDFQNSFARYLESKGFKILRTITNGVPDLIVKKDRSLIGIEFKIKGKAGYCRTTKALGQLLIAKELHNLNELWFVTDVLPKNYYDILYKIFHKKYGITTILFDGYWIKFLIEDRKEFMDQFK